MLCGCSSHYLSVLITHDTSRTELVNRRNPSLTAWLPDGTQRCKCTAVSKVSLSNVSNVLAAALPSIKLSDKISRFIFTHITFMVYVNTICTIPENKVRKEVAAEQTLCYTTHCTNTRGQDQQLQILAPH